MLLKITSKVLNLRNVAFLEKAQSNRDFSNKTNFFLLFHFNNGEQVKLEYASEKERDDAFEKILKKLDPILETF